jgi:hypothetical protein
VFGSQKRRPDTPISDDGETYRPNTVNFSRPLPGKRVTRSQPETLPTIIEESSPLYKRVKCLHLQDLVSNVSPPCKKPRYMSLFGILPAYPIPLGSLVGLIMRARKKCTARIDTNHKSIFASTYIGMWHHYKLQSMKRTDFVFCPDDIERCVKGPRRKWVMSFFADD